MKAQAIRERIERLMTEERIPSASGCHPGADIEWWSVDTMSELKALQWCERCGAIQFDGQGWRVPALFTSAGAPAPVQGAAK